MRNSHGASQELIELGNLATVGERILMAALQRKESRGSHYRSDYPRKAPARVGEEAEGVLPADRPAKGARQRSGSLVPAAVAGIEKKKREGKRGLRGSVGRH